MKLRRSFFAALIASTTVLAGCGNSESTQEAQPTVSTVMVQTAMYVERVSAIGRVGAPAGSETKLSFPEPGILQSMNVQIGEHVAADDALAQLDARGFGYAAAQAQADAQAAVANAHQASVDRTSTKIAVDEAALQREQTLYAAGVAAMKDIEAARAQLAADRADASSNAAGIEAANAEVQSAYARAASARRDLANGTLRAPIDGVITAIYKRNGEAVDPTTPVLAIAPETTNEVTLTVAASDAALVHAGDPVDLTVPGTNIRSTGYVTGVASALDPSTQTAMVAVSGVPSGAPAGSALEANITVATDRGIVIPQSAIVQDPQRGETLVFVETRTKDSVKFAQRQVRVAHQDGTHALIASGLHVGETIAAQGGFALLAPAGGGD